MPIYHAPVQDTLYLLNDVLGYGRYSNLPGFADASPDVLEAILAGASGFWMTYRLGAWDRFTDPHFWWMDAMVAVWVIFIFMLFVAEPLFLHRFIKERAKRDPDGTLRLVLRLHIVLLTLSLITIGAAVLGAHGALS